MRFKWLIFLLFFLIFLLKPISLPSHRIVYAREEAAVFVMLVEQILHGEQC
jgi:hypothetical protein